MFSISDAITEGTWTGIVTGFFDQGILIKDAEEMMKRMPVYKSELTPKEYGIIKGLIKLKLVRKKFLGPYVLEKFAHIVFQDNLKNQ